MTNSATEIRAHRRGGRKLADHPQGRNEAARDGHWAESDGSAKKLRAMSADSPSGSSSR